MLSSFTKGHFNLAMYVTLHGAHINVRKRTNYTIAMEMTSYAEAVIPCLYFRM